MAVGLASKIIRKQAKRQARKELITELVQHLRHANRLKSRAVRYSVYAILVLLVSVAFIVPDGFSDAGKAWIGILGFSLFSVFAVLTISTRSRIQLEYKKALLVFYDYGYEKRQDDVIDEEIGQLFGFDVPKNPSARYKDILDIQKERIVKNKMEVGFAKRLFEFYLDPVLHKQS